MILALTLALPGVTPIAVAQTPGVFEGSEGTLIAQSRRRRRRRRGRRSTAPKPKPKAKAEAEVKDKDAGKPDVKAKKKKKNKKAKAAKKKVTKKKKKKKAPKVAKVKGPFLPKNFGKIVMYSGVGLTAVGLGVAGWGATVHNGAVAERHTLQDREANNANQMQAFYDLHSDMETGKLIHFTGLGIAGFAALTAAVGSLL